jgi:glycerophosphoryl diester phosphodiesterase
MNRTLHTILLLTLSLYCIQINARVKVIAHRGGSSMAPENTLAAFGKAIQIKADYFELDIQVTSDDSLVIMHDETVNRTTSGSGAVSSMTYAQIRALDAGAWFGASFAGEKVPSFSEALQLAKNDPNGIGVIAEIKASTATIVEKTVKMIQDYKMTSRVVVSSFDFNQIAKVKTLDPAIRVQLFATATNSLIDQVAGINGEWIGSSGSVTADLLNYSHSKGVLFNSWTINTASQMSPLILLGVDAITTDYPAVLQGLTDTTNPGDVTLNTPIVNETKIKLTWLAAVDPESGISGYEIYRDVTPAPTKLLVSLGGVMEYVDATNTENKTYYYRAKAINGMGLKSLNYSNEVSAKTGGDTTKPAVSFVSSVCDTSNVVIEFSEAVDKTTAETKTNYTINKSVTVLAAKQTVNLKSVMLTTTRLTDTTYTLNIKNVKDMAAVPNVMPTTNIIFQHKSSPANMIAYYKMDELIYGAADTTLADNSGTGNNGVVKNGTALSEGLVGNGLKFDGADDYVQFSPSPSFDINGPAVSVTAWVKLDYLPADMPYGFGPIFDSDSDEYNLYEDKANNELRFKITTASYAAERPGIPGSALKTGEWIHLAGVYNGSQAQIYMNGVLKDSHPLTGNVKSGQAAMLGKSTVNGTPTFFKGSMDNIQVFNRALSASEVEDMYKSFRTAGVDPRPTDVAITSAVAKNTEITLAWTPAVTYESKLMGYEIYREGSPSPTTLYATVPAGITSYTDTTNSENKPFFYRIKAKNTDGLKSANFSNEVSAFTGSDNEAPKVLFITAKEDNTTVIIEFNERVNKASAETAANYSINNSVKVTGASLALDSKSVILQTSPLDELNYIIEIANIKDRAASANIMPKTSFVFSYKPLSQNLIALYTANNLRTDTLIDLTVNKNNGVFMSGATLTAGLLGNAVNFDGIGSYVQFAASPSFNPTNAVSVAVWAKYENLPTELSGSYGPLFDSQGDNYVIYADKGNKELRFKASASGGAARPGIPQADLITGNWINVVGVYDGTNAMIYLNGVKKGTLPLTGTIVSGQVAMLGKNGTASPIAYLLGQIDNVAVYNKALSQSEILDMYNSYKMPAQYLSIPVELTSFNASAGKNKNTLLWITSSEKNNAGFEIQRSGNKETFEKIGFVTGRGTTTEKHNYTFCDAVPLAGPNYYRLKQIDFDGNANYSNIVEAAPELPASFDVSQNFPNPFNPVTNINYQIPQKAHITLTVFNSLGQKVKTLADEIKEAGYYNVIWDGRDERNAGVAAGIYFYRIQGGSFVKTKKMIYLK